MAAVVSRTQILPSIPFELETSELEDYSVSETENTNTTTSNESEVQWNELEDQHVPESEFEGETTTAELSTNITIPTATTTVTESFISSPSSSSSVPTSTAVSLESSQTISEAAFEQRPPSPSGSEPPSMVLSFRSNVYHLFSSPNSDTSAETHVLFSDKHFLYKSPLQSFMSELQTHFSIENDVTLDFPDLNLSFGTHMIYAQKVTLAHVHLLSAAISSEQQFVLRATMTELPNAFLKQYNHLIVLAQSRKDSFIRPLSPSSTVQDLPVPPSIPQTTTGQSEFHSEAELEGEEEEEEEESFETSETVETIGELGNTDEMITEEAKEGDQLELNEETELEYPVPAAEEIDVEIDELNSDLLPPTENESPFSPSSVKPHARHYEAGDDEDELARKRPRFTAQSAETDSAGLAGFVDEGL